MKRFTPMLMVIELIVLLIWFSQMPWDPRRAIGAIIIVTSVLLVVVARLQLGEAFSGKAKAVKLVTTGLYSRVRNPIYLASGCLFVGIALLLGRWWPVLIFPVLVPVQITRAKREARVLEARFGEDYLRYRRSTWC